MNKKVLLVADDDHMSRMIISQFLKDEYTVVEADNGKKALELLAEIHVDVLLLDIIMPEMDGLEVLQKLRKDENLTNIGVLVATSTKEKTERSALALGADDIVSKPYDPVVIKKRLSNILAVKELNQNYALQQSADEDKILKAKLSKVQSRADKAADQIKRCTKLIYSNKENIALLNEMLAKIEKQAEMLETITEGIK